MLGRSPKDCLEFVQPSVFGMMEPNVIHQCDDEIGPPKISSEKKRRDKRISLRTIIDHGCLHLAPPLSFCVLTSLG